MRTVAAVFPTIEDANHVARHFEQMGVARKELKVVAGAHADHHELELVEKAKRSSLENARAGAIRGIVFGILVSSFLLKVAYKSLLTPTSLGFIAAGIAISTILMSLMVKLWNTNDMREELPLYTEAIQSHGVVVAAHIRKESAPVVVKILQEHNAREVRVETDAWKASGFTGIYDNSHPYPCHSTVTAH